MHNPLKMLAAMMSSRSISVDLPLPLEKRLQAALMRYNEDISDDPFDPQSDNDIGSALMAAAERGLEAEEEELGLHATLDGRLLTTMEYIAATITAQMKARRLRKEAHDKLAIQRDQDSVIDAVAKAIFDVLGVSASWERVADTYRRAAEQALKVKIEDEDLAFQWNGNTLTTLDGRTFKIRPLGRPDDQYFSGVEINTDGRALVNGPSFEGAGTVELAKKRVEKYVLETMGQKGR